MSTLSGLITVVLWASAFIGIRSAGHHLGAGELAFGRLLIAALALAGLVTVRRGWAEVARLVRGRRDVAPAVACGILWFGAYTVLLNLGEHRVDAGTAAMLVNVGPILIALLAGTVLREGYPRGLFAGLAVAFLGVLVIGLATRARGATAAGGVLLCLGAAGCYAAGVVAQKPVLARHSALAVTFVACLAGMAICLPWAPSLAQTVHHAPAGSLAWTVYLGLFPSAIAYTTWSYALSHTTAGRMGSLTYLVPPLAVLLAWLLLGEAPPVAALLGGALCLAGVTLTRRTTPRPRPAVLRGRPAWHSHRP